MPHNDIKQSVHFIRKTLYEVCLFILVIRPFDFPAEFPFPRFGVVGARLDTFIIIYEKHTARGVTPPNI